jgi:surfeit locus 1 family protein
MKRIPVLPTLIVLIAVGIMISLGVWQLGRMRQKEAMLALYRQAERSDAAVAWPRNPDEVPRRLFFQTRLRCESVSEQTTVSGHNRAGKNGFAQAATCRLADGTTARVILGWSTDPAIKPWQGGDVSGTIAPGPRLVVDPPIAGLQANALPNPSDVPNNHLSYAVQWFIFAGVALVIYGLAVRKRLAGEAPPR